MQRNWQGCFILGEQASSEKRLEKRAKKGEIQRKKFGNWQSFYWLGHAVKELRIIGNPCAEIIAFLFDFPNREVKNANIFVDVDLTLVDANGKLRAGATEALATLKEKGCHIFLWSTQGAEYARKVAGLYGLPHFFEGFAAKPDIIIDDMPATVLNPFVFDVNKEASWPALADKIIRKHLD